MDNITDNIMVYVSAGDPQRLNGSFALAAIQSLDNQHHYAKAAVGRHAVTRPRSRFKMDGAASPEPPVPMDNDFFNKERLVLRFDGKRNHREGYVFGSAADCDIRIPEENEFGCPATGLSRHHCILTFDDQRRLVIKDKSSCGSTVIYDDSPQKRKNFTWIVGGDPVLSGRVILLQLGDEVVFQLIVPEYDILSPRHIRNVDIFRNNFLSSSGSLRAAAGSSSADSAATVRPKQHPRPCTTSRC